MERFRDNGATDWRTVFFQHAPPPPLVGRRRRRDSESVEGSTRSNRLPIQRIGGRHGDVFPPCWSVSSAGGGHRLVIVCIYIHAAASGLGEECAPDLDSGCTRIGTNRSQPTRVTLLDRTEIQVDRAFQPPGRPYFVARPREFSLFRTTTYMPMESECVSRRDLRESGRDLNCPDTTTFGSNTNQYQDNIFL